MASDHSWADQWGEGGFGAMQEDEGDGKAKKEDTKKDSKAGAALKKIKTGTSSGFKWIKSQCQRKGSSTTTASK